MPFDYDVIKGSSVSFTPGSDSINFASIYSAGDFEIYASGSDSILDQNGFITTLVGASFTSLIASGRLFQHQRGWV